LIQTLPTSYLLKIDQKAEPGESQQLHFELKKGKIQIFLRNQAGHFCRINASGTMHPASLRHKNDPCIETVYTTC
jgi:hypothetical protein